MFQLPESDNTQIVSDVWDTICITVISGCKTIFFRPIFRFAETRSTDDAAVGRACRQRRRSARLPPADIAAAGVCRPELIGCCHLHTRSSPLPPVREVAPLVVQWGCPVQSPNGRNSLRASAQLTFQAGSALL